MVTFILNKYWTDVLEGDSRRIGKHKLVATSCFLRDNNGVSLVEIIFDTTISKTKARRDYNDCEIIPVSYNTWNQPDVQDLYLDNQRVGWIVPVSAVAESSEVLRLRSGGSRISVKRAIDIALWGLLFNEKCSRFFRFSGETTDDSFKIDEMYPTKMAIIIIDRTQLPNYSLNIDMIKKEVFTGFEIESLRTGFTLSPNYQPNSMIDRGIVTLDSSLRFKSLSNNLNNDIEVIRDLLEEAIRVDSPVVCFFLLYQVIEVLSSVSFACARGQIGRKLFLLEGPHDFRDFLELLDRNIISNIGSAKGILKLLFHNHWTGSRRSLHDLDNSASIFLRHLGYSVKNQDIFENTYQVRNLVVHSQARWKNDQVALQLLCAVSDKLLLLISDLLRSFSIIKGKKEVWRKLNT